MSIRSMRNGWTGGQYSLFRAVFGIYLLVHFAQLTPWALSCSPTRAFCRAQPKAR
jgi:hypothetical protein